MLTPDAISKSESSFLCTLCWQTQYPPARPKLLGSCARIVCTPCWSAVLDLSICWRCGECVFRSDEAASLGWCFWHRACFGCLVCGTYMNLDKFLAEINGGYLPPLSGSGFTSNSTLPGIQEEQDVAKTPEGLVNRDKGGELTCIPLCDWCRVENERQPEEIVLAEGLKTVTMFDGGLSRSRHERMANTQGQIIKEAPRVLVISPRAGSPMRSGKKRRSLFPLSKKKSWDAGLKQNGSTERLGLLSNAAGTRISEDGSNDSDSRYIEEPTSDHTSQVYIPILDPIGQPGFKPDATKPLPKWMSMLPSNIRKDDEDRLNQQIIDKSSHARGLHPLNEHSCGHHNPVFKEKTQEDATGSDTPRNASASSYGQGLTYTPEKRGRASTTSQIEAIRRMGKRRSSDMSVSTYKTAPEYPPIQQMPPYSSPRPSEVRQVSRKHQNSYFCGMDHDTPRCDKPCCALAKRPTSPDIHELDRLEPFSRSTRSLPQGSVISHSSEYLERYQPEKPAAKSPTYVAKVTEPIIDKIKKQREKMKKLNDGSEESNRKKAAIMKVIEEEFGLDPRRDDLNRQLRNLFGEE